MNLKHTQEGTVWGWLQGVVTRGRRYWEPVWITRFWPPSELEEQPGQVVTHTHTHQAHRSSKPKGHILGQRIKVVLLVAGLTQEEWKCLG